jgi:hypothetical protein
VAGVGPPRERRLEVAAELGLGGPVRAPRHDRPLQPEQTEVPEGVLAILLAHVHDRLAAMGNAGLAAEVLDVREQVPPLRHQQVHDVESLGGRLHVRAIRR